MNFDDIGFNIFGKCGNSFSSTVCAHSIKTSLVLSLDAKMSSSHNFPGNNFVSTFFDIFYPRYWRAHRCSDETPQSSKPHTIRDILTVAHFENINFSLFATAMYALTSAVRALTLSLQSSIPAVSRCLSMKTSHWVDASNSFDRLSQDGIDSQQTSFWNPRENGVFFESISLED